MGGNSTTSFHKQQKAHPRLKFSLKQRNNFYRSIPSSVIRDLKKTHPKVKRRPQKSSLKVTIMSDFRATFNVILELCQRALINF